MTNSFNVEQRLQRIHQEGFNDRGLFLFQLLLLETNVKDTLTLKKIIDFWEKYSYQFEETLLCQERVKEIVYILYRPLPYAPDIHEENDYSLFERASSALTFP